MINPRIRYENEPGFGAYVLPNFKAIFWPCFVDGLRRKYACSEAIFICITYSRIYIIIWLPEGNNLSIDKLYNYQGSFAFNVVYITIYILPLAIQALPLAAILYPAGHV